MKNNPRSRTQHGVVLVIGLIMLVMITLMVVTAFQISTGNLKMVGNLQFRNEAIAAANALVEKSLNVTNFSGHAEGIDLNNDGTNDYTVTIARTCLRASAAAPVTTGFGSSTSLPFTSGAKNYWVLWDYNATVTDTATGSSVNLHHGVKQLLNQSQCDTQCPPSSTVSCS